MLRTPAFTAACAPSAPWAWASTGTPRRGGFADDRGQVGLRVDLLARIGVGRAGALGRQHLDPIHRMSEVHSNESPKRVWRGKAGLEQVAQVGRVEVRLDGRLRPHVVPGGLDVGPGQRAALDQLAQADILEMRDAGTSHGGDAALQGRAHGRQSGDVDVRVDQARQEIATAEVDAAQVCGRSRQRRSHRRDAPVAHDHDRPAPDLTGADVDDRGVHQEHRRRRDGGLRRGRPARRHDRGEGRRGDRDPADHRAESTAPRPRAVSQYTTQCYIDATQPNSDAPLPVGSLEALARKPQACWGLLGAGSSAGDTAARADYGRIPSRSRQYAQSQEVSREGAVSRRSRNLDCVRGRQPPPAGSLDQTQLVRPADAQVAPEDQATAGLATDDRLPVSGLRPGSPPGHPRRQEARGVAAEREGRRDQGHDPRARRAHPDGEGLPAARPFRRRHGHRHRVLQAPRRGLPGPRHPRPQRREAAQPRQQHHQARPWLGAHRRPHQPLQHDVRPVLHGRQPGRLRP